MILLDTNVWTGYIYTDDSLHAKSVECIENAVDTPLVLFEYVAIETITVLAHRSGKRDADRFIDYAQNTDGIEVLSSSEELLGEVMAFYSGHAQRNLSFTDYALLYLSHHATIATFDVKLRNAIKREGGNVYIPQ